MDLTGQICTKSLTEKETVFTELVLKICKFMQLSHAEQKEMEQAYEITLIGHDTYYRRKAVVDFFNNFRLSKLNLPVLSELNTEILFEKGSVTLNTMAEVNRSLLYIISLEVKNPTARSTFSYSRTAIF